MGARARMTAAAVLCAGVGATSVVTSEASPKEPAPSAVVFNPDKAEVIVLADRAKNIYVLAMGESRSVYVGKGDKLYEQPGVRFSSDGKTWSVAMWTPRLNENRDGYIRHEASGSFVKSCWGADDAVLTEQTGEKAKAILDKAKFLSPFATRGAHLLARDDAGVYYYVDQYARRYGGNGYRVFVGRKGAMKQLPLTDVASDSAGEVFATKTGQLRLVKNAHADGSTDVMWIKAQTKSPLIFLRVDDNSQLIYRDLGLYGRLGTICDDV